MDRTTDNADGITAFYDDLAASYDAMTGFSGRFDKERSAFQQFVDSYRIGTAIDAGAGTGFHAILLAQLGVKVTAIDVSDAMLVRAQQNAADFGVELRTLRAPFSDIPRFSAEPVDAVFCLGNSLAHLLSDESLADALRSFHAVLKPGGLLVLQTVNFRRILTARRRVQSVREVAGRTYIRFYDFLPETIEFNILAIERQGAEFRHQLASVPLRPVHSESMTNLLVASGFIEATVFGSIDKTPYDPEHSPDLVMVAVTPTR